MAGRDPTKMRVLLDLRYVPALDADSLSDRWTDVTPQFPALEDAPVAILEFDGEPEELDRLRDDGPLGGFDDMVRLATSGEPPPWAPLGPIVVPFIPNQASTSTSRDPAPTAHTPEVRTAEKGDVDPLYEQRLLMRLKSRDREGFAGKLLEARLRRIGQEVDRDEAQTKVIAAQADFEKERVAHARETTAGVKERVEHMKEWRRIAKFGVGLLIATTAIAIWAVWYLVRGPVGDGDMSGETLSLVAFALAVFAASPATLLLLERPLKGIDSWSPAASVDSEPGGKADS